MNTIAANRPMVSLGGVNAYTPGLSISPRNPEGFFTLYGEPYSGTTPTMPFYKDGVLYQVTAGKTCKVYAMSAITLVANTPGTGTVGSGAFQLVSATASFSTGATSITGGVFQFGATRKYGNIMLTVAVWYHWYYTYSFGATTYPGYETPSSNPVQVNLLCREV